MVYNSIILPLFDYADIVYDSTSKKYTDRLQKLQNRAGRIIFKINPYNHVSNNDIHVKWGWKSFHSRRKLHPNIMVSKSQNTLAPPYLEESFKYCIYPYSLRSQWHIKLPKPKSECCRKMFVYKGSREYNDLPLTIKLSNSLKTFCKNLNLRNSVLLWSVMEHAWDRGCLCFSNILICFRFYMYSNYIILCWIVCCLITVIILIPGPQWRTVLL